MAYEAWQPLVAGAFLLVSGGIHVAAPYQAARKAAMEDGHEDDVTDEWEIDATQIIGGITAFVGFVIFVRGLFSL